jgi:hypothetical protein
MTSKPPQQELLGEVPEESSEYTRSLKDLCACLVRIENFDRSLPYAVWADKIAIPIPEYRQCSRDNAKHSIEAVMKELRLEGVPGPTIKRALHDAHQLNISIQSKISGVPVTPLIKEGTCRNLKR